MRRNNELKYKLNEYKIDGNKNELRNIVYSNALVAISAVRITSVLSLNKTNYIRLGYGETLIKAYENGCVKGKNCKLIYIYFSEGGMTFIDLYNFIESLEDDIILGYTKDETLNSGLKLVMIFN